MPRRRSRYSLPQGSRPLGGENTADGLTDAVFQAGALYRCRNYELVGRRNLRSRYGWQDFLPALNGASPIEGLGVRHFGGSRQLVGVSAGAIKVETGGAWSDITGSLTPTGGQNVFTRFCQFHDGTNGHLLGCDGDSNPWYYAGSGNATALALTQAQDLAPFKQHVLAINTGLRPTAIQYTKPGLVAGADDWPANNAFDCTRDSEGRALALHNAETVLAFYDESIHRINFNYGAGAGGLSSFFTNHLVDGSRGLAARASVLTYKGATYFCSDNGFYRIRSPSRPAEYISRSQEGFFGGLNKARIQHIAGFVRGEPYNGLAWAVSTGSNTAPNAWMVFYPDIAALYGDDFAWAVFDSPLGYLPFNCGVNWIDSAGVHWSALGATDGTVKKAWGTEENPTGTTDGDPEGTGGVIETELQTGFCALGGDVMKGLREVILDMILADEKVFDVQVDRGDESVQLTGQVEMGAPADLLSDDFILNESFLAGGTGITQEAIKAEGDGRWFRLRLYQNSDGKPHTLLGITFVFVPKAMRVR